MFAVGIIFMEAFLFTFPLAGNAFYHSKLLFRLNMHSLFTKNTKGGSSRCSFGILSGSKLSLSPSPFDPPPPHTVDDGRRMQSPHQGLSLEDLFSFCWVQIIGFCWDTNRHGNNAPLLLLFITTCMPVTHHTTCNFVITCAIAKLISPAKPY